ncbi:MAG: hypothetical protein QY325_00890 [Flavobacteriales bacterium]|nr:MAG: hypothetical protein QY325_00890 [Flavobacteriales bacterium]
MHNPARFLLLCFAWATSNLLSAQRKDVAVVTFYVDRYISTSDLNSSASLVASLSTLAKDERFDLTSVLAKFHDDFFTNHAKQFNFSFLPESEVTGNPEYQAFVSRFGESEQDGTQPLDGMIPYPGYKVLIPNALKRENSNKMKMLEIFKGKADGVMFISLGFKFQPKVAIGGMGSAGIAAVMNLMLFDGEGNRVFNFVEYAPANGSVAMVMGIPVVELEEIKPLCEQAAENLLRDLAGKMPKLIKKVEKKF